MLQIAVSNYRCREISLLIVIFCSGSYYSDNRSSDFIAGLLFGSLQGFYDFGEEGRESENLKPGDESFQCGIDNIPAGLRQRHGAKK